MRDLLDSDIKTFDEESSQSMVVRTTPRHLAGEEDEYKLPPEERERRITLYAARAEEGMRLESEGKLPSDYTVFGEVLEAKEEGR